MRSVSAMFLLILSAALALAGAIGTVRALLSDGYRRIPTDPTRLP
jgi:multisubunit Na+/H+ antiporter MnhG subunit